MEMVNLSFLQPVIEGCLQNGVNYDKLIRKTPMRYFDFNGLDKFSTMSAANTFIDTLAQEQGIDNIAQEFASNIKLSALGDFGESIALAPTLLDSLSLAEKLSSAILSNEVMKITTNGNKAIFHQDFSRLPHDEYSNIVQINYIYILEAFIYLTSEGFCPDEIHFQEGFCPSLLELFPNFANAKVRCNQPYTAIIFDSYELTHKLGAIMDNEQIVGTHDGTLRQTIELIIDSFSTHVGGPTITSVAYLLDMSERTLRRRLTEEGTSFQEILSSWRLRKAITLLHNPSISINEASEQLFYTNPNNFTRSFKQAFKVSPKQFRDNCIKTV